MNAFSPQCAKTKLRDGVAEAERESISIRRAGPRIKVYWQITHSRSRVDPIPKLSVCAMAEAAFDAPEKRG
jgi:hypothetical protein